MSTNDKRGTINPGAGRTKVFDNPRQMLADSSSNNSDAVEDSRRDDWSPREK
ncbi:hypothetical protein [Microbacterium sp. Root180]|uniref:hypothetical protein n=1 Tax=Microbacterium sp. Root180 TaxID=1736483 RepID=UPI000ACE7AF0|nr:hypothetical protein [Microbacterium sp. Root180]